MFDFSFLKAFKVQVHPHKASLIKEVFWSPPNHPWIKCNTKTHLLVWLILLLVEEFLGQPQVLVLVIFPLILELTTPFMLSLWESSLI